MATISKTKLEQSPASYGKASGRRPNDADAEEVLPKGTRRRLHIVMVLGSLLVVTLTGNLKWNLSSYKDISKAIAFESAVNDGDTASHLGSSWISELWSTSLIHDETLPWDPSVYREWIAYEHGDENAPKPSVMLLLTNDGWNQRNQTAGKMIPRSIRHRELMVGIINHPWFHPTFWEDLEEGRISIPSNDTTRYYIFWDRPIMHDSHYPIYGGYNKNLDLADGRPEEVHIEWPSTHFFKRKLFLEAPGRVRLMHFHSGGWGLDNYDRLNGSIADWPISFIPYSDLVSRVNATWDQGQIPPAGKTAILSPSQKEDIATCAAETKRKFFVTYLGNGRSGRNQPFHQKYAGARSGYFPLHDNKTVFAGPPEKKNIQESGLASLPFETMLMETVFGLAPRGDCKFSYRFTEVMAAAAIPVVHADDWLWPFRPELVDWNECAVIMPEKDAGNVTLQILKDMSIEDRCRRRQRCLQIYQDFIERPERIIHGLVEGLERVVTTGVKPFVGVKCSDYNYSSECNMER